MRWEKKGLVYCPDGSLWWARSHAAIPTPLLLDEDRMRIYIACRDGDNVSRIGYVDVNAEDPGEVLEVAREPVLDVGEPGTFDDNGVLPSCIISVGKKLFLFYIGFQLGVKRRYYIFSGLAESVDGGESFKRVYQVPVLDRVDGELFFRTAPHVMEEHGLYRMWYIGGSGWTEVGDKMVPIYHVRYLESTDHERWAGTGKRLWDFKDEDEHGFGRPFVYKIGDLYHMIYSRRLRSKGYRLGYAESTDGISWVRKDESLGMEVSAEGWDSSDLCFASLVETEDKIILLYNGNNFGETGFGYAVLADS